MHPVAHKRHTESHFDDPVDSDFHILVVFALIGKQVEEYLQILATDSLLEERLACLCRFNHVLEENEEGSDLVVIVIIQAFSHNFEQLLYQCPVVIAIMHVSFGQGNNRACFMRSCKELNDVNNIRHEQNEILLRK